MLRNKGVAATFLAGKHHVATQGVLSYYESAATTLVCRTGFGAKSQLAVLLFNSGDGSIHVDFPYFTANDGIIAEFPPRPPGPYTYEFFRHGKHVSDLMLPGPGTGAADGECEEGASSAAPPMPFAPTPALKFSHPKSGIVHFSKTGLIDPLDCPRRQSFPLNGDGGLLFHLFAFRLSGFRQYEKPSKGRTYLAFDFPSQHPTGVVMEAHWLPKPLVASRIDRPDGRIGPENVEIDRRTGRERLVVFIGQPAGFPLQSHLVRLSVEETPVPDGADIPGMHFFGGYDDPKQPRPDPSLVSGNLGFMYMKRSVPQPSDAAS